MDYSIRFSANTKRLKILENLAVNKQKLPRIIDVLYRPKSKSLEQFPPNKSVIRLRIFVDEKKPATLVQMHFLKTGSGYTDERETFGEGKPESLASKAKELNFVEWGELKTVSVEYDLGGGVQALYQDITAVGKFIKLEAENQESLQEALEKLKVNKDEKISKNAAELLFERQVKK